MQLLALRLINFKQFKDVYIDFVDKDGSALEKVCFIGRNGTGKSTLLKLIDSILKEPFSLNLRETFSLSSDEKYALIYSLKFKDQVYHIFNDFQTASCVYNNKIESVDNWQQYLLSIKESGIRKDCPEFFADTDSLVDSYFEMIEKEFLQIYSPAESYNNEYLKIEDAPDTSLGDALALKEKLPVYVQVDSSTVKEFWNVLIYLIRERESQRSEFENRDENLEKTKKELIKLFDSENPKILDRIATIWNKILDKAGLEFDLSNVNNPIQKTDNLKASIKLKNSGKVLKYNELSTGIRNFIFRIGHICSLYFNRQIESGFLLIDEPENSLYPDFLIDILDLYLDAVKDKRDKNNTQLFMATHSPLVAGQFEPEEKIILDWNNNGFVDVRKGKSPAGDDPNDVLKEDFGLSEVLGKKGIEMWQRFVTLKQQLVSDSNGIDQQSVIDEIVKIQELYKF